MFHISISELALTCGLLLVLIIVPLIIARSQAEMHKRLKDIEKKLNKKD